MKRNKSNEERKVDEKERTKLGEEQRYEGKVVNER